MEKLLTISCCGFVSLSGYPVSILSKCNLMQKVNLWRTHSLVLASSVSFGLDLNFNCFFTVTTFKDASAGSGVSLISKSHHARRFLTIFPQLWPEEALERYFGGTDKSSRL